VDIFTTALTKVRLSPIKPEKLKVKALNKEPETRELTEDFDHLENHDLYFINEKKQREQEQQKQKTKHSEVENHEFSDKNIIPSESVITDKQEILHPHKAHDDEDDSKHLDIFV
jgi:hypothetical protein